MTTDWSEEKAKRCEHFSVPRDRVNLHRFKFTLKDKKTHIMHLPKCFSMFIIYKNVYEINEDTEVTRQYDMTENKLHEKGTGRKPKSIYSYCLWNVRLFIF